MNVSFLTDESGRRTHAVIPLKVFERMTSALEDAIDVAESDRILQRLATGEEEPVPSEIVDRLLNENPIRVWREYRGITQHQLAVSIGLSDGYLSQLESGTRTGSTSTVAKLARALRVDMEDLI